MKPPNFVYVNQIDLVVYKTDLMRPEKKPVNHKTQSIAKQITAKSNKF